MRYQTFDLTISATGVPHEYLISARCTQGQDQQRAKIEVNVAPISEFLFELQSRGPSPGSAVPEKSRHVGTVATINAVPLSAKLKAFGNTLYQALFVEKINELFKLAYGEISRKEDLGLRLELHLDAPEVAALPWEFLYSSQFDLFLAASVKIPLSRYSNQPQPIRELTAPEKINLLAVMTKNSGLDTSGERLALQEVAAKLGGKISVDFLEGEATNPAIRAALRKKNYHIFHYAGHGSFTNDKACIHLDDGAGGSTPLDASGFAQFFLDYPAMRLVFLNACQGAARSAQQALMGVAPQLVLRGVPAVIAMQYTIRNDDAILFATEFYEELCRERDGGQVEVAISRARKALLQDRPESHAFGNPVLYLRAEDGRLWQSQLERPVKPAGPVAAIPVPPLLPYLSDRSAQETELGQALHFLQKNKPRRPFICIVHGDEYEGHDMYRERLLKVTLPKLLHFDTERDFFKEYTMLWPAGGFSKQKSNGLMQSYLASALVGNSAASTQEMVAEIFRQEMPVMIHTQLLTGDWAYAQPELTMEFLALWNRWPDYAPDRLLIIIVFLKYQRPEKLGFLQRRKLKTLNETIRRFLSQLDFSKFDQLHGVVLSELCAISRREVEDWVTIHAREFCQTDVLLPKIRALYERKELSTPEGGITMEKLAEELKKLLNEHRC